MTLFLLLCSHSLNDVPPERQQNISIATVWGAVHPLNDTVEVSPLSIVPFLSLSVCFPE